MYFLNKVYENKCHECLLNHLIFQANEKFHKVAPLPQKGGIHRHTGKKANKKHSKDFLKFKHVLKPSTVRFQSCPTKRYTVQKRNNLAGMLNNYAPLLHSLNFHSCLHMGHCCCTCCEFSHFKMQCM